MAQAREPAAPRPPARTARGQPGGSSDAETRRNLPFNFRLLLFHGLFGQTGFRLVNAPTFLPDYLSLLTGSNAAVGVARALQSLGLFLSPLFAAAVVEGRTHVRGFTLLFGLLQRSQILLLALTALLVPAEYAIVVIRVVIGVWGFANGLQRVAFNVLMAKTIPPEVRGRLLGLRNTASGVTIFFVSIGGGLLVQQYGFPRGYGLTFLLGFALACVGLIGIAALRETAHAEALENLPFATRIGRVREMLRNEPNFRRFVSARLLATAARGAVPFYIILVREELGLTGERLAALTIMFVMAQSFSTLGWGLLADRHGFRGVFLGALATWLAGVGLLITAPSLEGIYLVFGLVGAGMGGFMLASQQLVLEFGTAHELPTRIAGTNALSELVGVVGFLVAGLLADQIPLAWLFGLAAALQGLAVLQILAVKEPRKRPAESAPWEEP